MIPRWRTRDGRTIAVSQMTTEHIENCVKWLRSKGFVSIREHQAALPSPISCSGEMASYYAEIGWEHEFEAWTKAKRTVWLDLFERALAVRRLTKS